jgi:peptidoglycan hydrolase CwlO-like protein
MNHARFIALSFAALAMACLVGCGGSTEEAATAAEGLADTAAEAVETAGEDLAEQAADMTPEDLKATLDEIQRQIEEKEGELGDITEKIEGLSPADLMGDEAKEWQAKSDSLMEEIKSLKEKLQAYTDAKVE